MDSQQLRSIAVVTVAVIAVIVVLQQCRKPTWWPGRLLLWNMNAKHGRVTNWGLSQVEIEKQFTILDVGCGGGRTIDTLASLATEGKVYGIDYSAESVATARRTNQRWIAAGRVDIRPGTVSSLPFPDRSFDLVTAVETHYYWPSLVSDLREILRVLKPGGRVVVIAETYKGMRFDKAFQLAMRLLRSTYLSESEHGEVLSAAGYAEVDVFVERKKGWICAVGRRPL